MPLLPPDAADISRFADAMLRLIILSPALLLRQFSSLPPMLSIAAFRLFFRFLTPLISPR